MHIRVTASVTFEYDTDDGLVEDVNEAVEDAKDILGSLSPGDFTVLAEVNPPDASQ